MNRDEIICMAREALDALEELNGWQSLAPPLVSQAARRTAVNLRAIIETEIKTDKSEPVEWVESPFGDVWKTPPRREWQGLDAEEIWGITCECDIDYECAINFGKDIEAALKEKNT